MRPVTFLAALALAAAAAVPARAQDCLPPDVLGTTPEDGASGFPTDGALRARYAPTALYDDEAVPMRAAGSSSFAPPVFFDEGEWALVAMPAETLLPGATYEITWPALSSVDGSTIGRGATTRLTTGPGPDLAAPRFEGLRAVDWDVRKDHDDCTDAAEERYFFRIVPGVVEDDAGAGALELMVFQTVGPQMGEGAPPLTVAVSSMPAAGRSLEVALPRSASLGRVCFVAEVRDPVGRLSAGSPELCTTTRQPPFWEGCAAVPGRSTTGAVACLLAVLALTRPRRARRYCRRPRRSA